MKKLMIILLGLTILTGCQSARFNGNRTGNENQFIMEYRIFNGSDSQILELEKNDILDIEIVNESGNISVLIEKEDQEVIYSEDKVKNKSFQITIHEDGQYKVTVTGENAKGSVYFVKK